MCRVSGRSGGSIDALPCHGDEPARLQRTWKYNYKEVSRMNASEWTMIQEAVQKKHSTISEAITTGIQMNCTSIVLTHFSQRYPKFPMTDQNICAAFDLMKINFQNISVFSCFNPVFSILYGEDDIDETQPSQLLYNM